MEDREMVAKVLLECYQYLEDLYYSTEESMKNCVADSQYAIYPNDTMRVYEQVERYGYRMKGIYNMKYVIEQGISKLQGSLKSVIVAHYVNKTNIGLVASKNNVSIRTCYRYLIKGLSAFADALDELGFDKKRIIKEFNDEPLFMMMLNKIIKEDDDMQAMMKKSQEESQKRALLTLRNSHHSNHHICEERAYA